MLRVRAWHRVVAMLLAVTAGVAASIITVVVVAPSAGADECWQWVETSPGKTVYVNTCEDDGGDGDDGDDGGGGGDEPQCYLGRLEALSYDDAWCEGDLSCYLYAPPPGEDDPAEWPEPPAGTDENALYGRYSCFTQPPAEDLVISMQDWWGDPPTPDWPAEALQALGQISVPDFALRFDPADKTFVAVATSFWADGADDSALTGTSALGLVAIATPDRFEVDPGDGSGTMSCDFAVSSGDDSCSHTYMETSNGQSGNAGGRAAFPAEARLVYSVSFELNGAPMTIPGVPTELEGEWEQAGVPVGEVQVLVQ